MKILFIGDVIGKPGRSAVKSLLPLLKAETGFDAVIMNGENVSGGMGITPQEANEIFDTGIDLITTGNHVWKKKEILDFLNRSDRIVRPANYPPGAPGTGSLTYRTKTGSVIGLINLLGRVFMHETLDCPFRVADSELKKIGEHTKIILVDFHAEATSEKRALAYHLDGRVTALVGTHTHVQTADEQILAGGTGFITDVGMAGPSDSVIGMRKEIILQKFKSQLPASFQVASGEVILDAVLIEADERTGRCLKISRIRRSHS